MSITSVLQDTKARLDSLLTFANETTGQSDVSIGDAVKTLVDGFGRGGSVLPAGYSQLEYIENTGQGYINTGVVPNINTEAVIKFVKRYPQAENYTTPFGVNSSGASFFGFQTQANADDFVIRQLGFFSFGNTSDKSGWHPTCDTIDPLSFRFNKNGCSWIGSDGDVIKSGGSFGVTSFASANLPIFLFARNSNDGAARFCKCAIYDFKLNDIATGTCLWHGIPAKRNSDGQFGMFDIINNTFHVNLGSTAFIGK